MRENLEIEYKTDSTMWKYRWSGFIWNGHRFRPQTQS